jgi:hypothetical protein
MDFHRTLFDVGSRLDGAGCRWAVIGGVAMGIYGVLRTTVDVDLLVGEECVPRLAELLGGLGYELKFAWEESSHFVAEAEHHCPLDILHAHRPHSLAMLGRARRVPMGEPRIEVPVVDLADLIGLKVQAMVNDPERRRGESVDIRALLEAASGREEALDMARVREYFALFGEERELEELSEGLEGAFA